MLMPPGVKVFIAVGPQSCRRTILESHFPCGSVASSALGGFYSRWGAPHSA